MNSIWKICKGLPRRRCELLATMLMVLVLLNPLLVSAANAVLFVAWLALQLMSSHRSRAVGQLTAAAQTPSETLELREPFISIHVAIYDEPPQLVCKTLDALSTLNYCAYEVIVIDNNTPDPSRWMPVKVHCESLGEIFLFLHEMGVEGAKAGALNISRQYTSKRSSYIATVDGDYQVAPNFLSEAMCVLQASHADYVQFPQAYRVRTPIQISLDSELTDYFDRHANATVNDCSMLLTGTLSAIGIHALDAAGGWPTHTITEDAELGIKLQALGKRGIYSGRHVGKGLLPLSVSELKKQRQRWITGNIHVLIQALNNASVYLQATHVAQLTAWCSFLAIPALIAIVLPLATPFVNTPQNGSHMAMAISFVTVVGHLLAYAILSREKAGFFSIKWALGLSSGWSTLSALAGARTLFLRTDRVASTHEYWRHCAWRSIPMLIALVLSALSGWWIAALTLMLLLPCSALQVLLDKQLQTEELGVSHTATNWRTPHVS